VIALGCTAGRVALRAPAHRSAEQSSRRHQHWEQAPGPIVYRRDDSTGVCLRCGRRLLGGTTPNGKRTPPVGTRRDESSRYRRLHLWAALWRARAVGGVADRGGGCRGYRCALHAVSIGAAVAAVRAQHWGRPYLTGDARHARMVTQTVNALLGLHAGRTLIYLELRAATSA